MLEDYIKISLIKAESCERNNEPGYRVVFPHLGVDRWVSADLFEQTHLKVTPNESLPSNISISQEMVDNFIVDVETITMGEKTTVVRATLVNGYEIVKASACVDPANYSEEIGKEICLNKIKDEIWAYLGFLLQTAVNGFKQEV